ncbi:MAG: glycosyltransferase [Candidatus Latescibacteria bacterium]|nr:glycosyltransferase [Candidatus Latescibacterota bacterium]NIM21809.1 glycosyltransferase [Candidatus Latescibacterota bacterium]NIM65947.1 glycosyltransferase [Candidatus Latescibacterota bacterium]NIO02692.1 glycosyltransferase [Candidatus Latescibacterota bacterium]NIO29673.1 glycosyltransferase [Candidatus Latescibacterota bacterium]
MSSATRWGIWAAGVIIAALCFCVSLVGDLRTNLPLFFVLFGFSFCAYAGAVYLIWQAGRASRRLVAWIFIIAVITRMAMAASPPSLSSDAYRYLWEGRIILEGFNPFAHAPDSPELEYMRDENYDGINHKHLETIYPPLAQGVFALGAAARPDLMTQKIIFIAFDLAVLVVILLLLTARGGNAGLCAIYGWSPLAAFEFAHSGHLDSIAIFFMMLGILYIERSKRLGGAVSLALSFLSKYATAMLMPFFLVRKRLAAYVGVFILVVVLGYLPCVGASAKLFSSLHIYASQWEFNSVPYGMLHALGGDPQWIRRALIGLLIVFAFSQGFRQKEFLRFAYLVVGCSLLLTPTVYPWYVCWILPFLCFYPNRAWLLFTGLVIGSYWAWARLAESGEWGVGIPMMALEYAPLYGLFLLGSFRAGSREHKSPRTATEPPNEGVGKKGSMKTTIIIPAFNEESSIGLVLDEIPKGEAAEVLVVDNGSTDRTAEVAKKHGATVLHEERRGYGAACLKGLSHLDEDVDVVVFLDGDHSDYPEDLAALLEPIRSGEADFVIGSRVLGRPERGALQWNQLFGNALACSLIRLLYGTRFTDMGPFRAAKRRGFDTLRMSDPTYGWNAEMQVKAIIEGLRIVEVPVRYRRRIGKSKISGTVKGTVLAGLKIIGTILKCYPRYVRCRGWARRIR